MSCDTIDIMRIFCKRNWSKVIHLGSPFQLGNSIIVLSLYNRDAFSKGEIASQRSKMFCMIPTNDSASFYVFNDACRKAYLFWQDISIRVLELSRIKMMWKSYLLFIWRKIMPLIGCFFGDILKIHISMI